MRFPGLITIDLSKGPNDVIVLNMPLCDCIWLPKFVLVSGLTFANPLDAVIAVKVNDEFGQEHPWALKDGYMNRIAGRITKLYVRVLASSGGSLYLATGQGATGSYSNPDGISPSFGPGSFTAQV